MGAHRSCSPGIRPRHQFGNTPRRAVFRSRPDLDVRKAWHQAGRWSRSRLCALAVGNQRRVHGRQATPFLRQGTWGPQLETIGDAAALGARLILRIAALELDGIPAAAVSSCPFEISGSGSMPIRVGVRGPSDQRHLNPAQTDVGDPSPRLIELLQHRLTPRDSASATPPGSRRATAAALRGYSRVAPDPWFGPP